MAGTIVNADWWVSEQATWAQAKHDAGGSRLKLFSNNFTPTPASVWADFVEATFTGYADVDLAADWSMPVQITPGEYASSTSFSEFASTDEAGQQIYGWVIVNSSPRVIHSGKLPVPVFMISPQILRLKITYQDWAIILL